jgi:hypothetical protein
MKLDLRRVLMFGFLRKAPPAEVAYLRRRIFELEMNRGAMLSIPQHAFAHLADFIHSVADLQAQAHPGRHVDDLHLVASAVMDMAKGKEAPHALMDDLFRRHPGVGSMGYEPIAGLFELAASLLRDSHVSAHASTPVQPDGRLPEPADFGLTADVAFTVTRAGRAGNRPVTWPEFLGFLEACEVDVRRDDAAVAAAIAGIPFEVDGAEVSFRINHAETGLKDGDGKGV